MAGYTLAEAEAKLIAYMDAEDKILSGQEVAMNGRSLKRADLAAIQAGIETWNNRVKRLTRGGMRSYNPVPQG